MAGKLNRRQATESDDAALSDLLKQKLNDINSGSKQPCRGGFGCLVSYILYIQMITHLMQSRVFYIFLDVFDGSVLR